MAKGALMLFESQSSVRAAALVVLVAASTAVSLFRSGLARADEVVATASEVEEIYVLRSVREKRSKPAVTCSNAATGINDPGWEDHYSFRSIAVRSVDGRVLDTDVKPAGIIDACFGRTPDPTLFDFYGEFAVNGIAGKARGTCHALRNDFPEAGINLFGCMFALSDLPPPYTGGQLTTNSVSSKQLFGLESVPAGYTQVSIATIRLWKPRTAK